jgi:hypothetical protein
MRAAAITCAALCGLAQSLMHTGSWNTQGASAWATITWTNGNLTAIADNYAANKQVALWPLAWTASQAKPCYAPVTHTQTTADGTFGCITIDPGYKAAWAKQWAEIKPAAQSGALVGVFLGDEHVWFGMDM